MARFAYERLLVGPEEEDSRGQRTRHAHRRGRQDLQRWSLYRQALRCRSAPGKIPRPEEASWLETETGRSGEEAAGSGPPRAAGCGAPPEARVLGADGGGFGERLHDQQDAQAHGLEQKKDRWVRQNATSS